MATQVQTMAAPRWASNKALQTGLFNQIITLLTHPIAFFKHMPRTRHWVFIAALILFIAGFTGSAQSTGNSTSASPSASSSAVSSTAATAPQAAGSARSQATSGTGANTTAAAPVATSEQQNTGQDAKTMLMTGLLAASGLLAMWVGQSALLCLVSMFRSYAPNPGRSLQIAVWASLPLALMLVLRQIYFAMGGTGGSLGLSLLLTQWDGYASLGLAARRVLEVFMSNISLFTLWNLLLLYFGARYALSGNRLSVMLVTAMWIVSAALVPALAGSAITSTAPRMTTSISAQQRATMPSTNSGTTTQQPGAGAFPGGMPPDGAMPPMGAGNPPGNIAGSASGSQTNPR
jgi:hypothetical protein